MKNIAATLLLTFTLIATTASHAVTGVNPSGVNIKSTGVTTVFLTFQNLRPNERAVEAFWCGDVTSTGVSSVNPCLPGTLFGQLPVRNDLSRRSGAGGSSNLTDIMTIPASVARRAYQDARGGAASSFFYVRRFTDGANDTFVTVTCRMAGGGARVPLALTHVAMNFDTEEGRRPVYFVGRDERLKSFGADIRYNGSGRLKGRWEVVQPGDPEPTQDDLLPESSLPIELRGLQQRYTLVDRFDVFLPPTGKFYLPGPNPKKVPRETDGPYQLLLRIESSADKEGNSTTITGSDSSEDIFDDFAGIVTSGGVAGFPLPVLKFFVGTREAVVATQKAAATDQLALLLPGSGIEVPTGQPISFSWTTIPAAAFYRLEVTDSTDDVLSAILPNARNTYTAPPWATESVSENLRWRVIALAADGRAIKRSGWRQIRVSVRQ